MIARFASTAIFFAMLVAACTTPMAASGQAAADEMGDPTSGLAYVQDHCSTCHAVRAGQRVSPIASAPPFQAVADMPGFTRTALNAWLHTSHPNMPNLIVESGRVDDIYAYLSTLRTRS